MRSIPLRNDHQRWGAATIAVHWLTVALVFLMALVGLIMVDLPTGALKLQVYAVHKSVGITVLALTALRLAWRLANPTPAALVGTPDWQQWLARSTHGGLYALLFAIPLSGWWYNSAAGFPLRWFGWLSLPPLTGYDPRIKALAHDVHEITFYALAGLVALHAGAALWHHFQRHDRTLARMLPGVEPEPSNPESAA